MTMVPYSMVASLLGLACLLVAGCEMSYSDNKDGSSEQQAYVSTGSEDGTTSDTTQIDSSSEPGFGGDVIAGDPADKGSEIYRSNWQGHDVRCLGADDTGHGYFMSDVIDQTGALDLGSDGVATGHNFISPRTGLHYRFEGFRETSSSSRLIRENPHGVTPGSGTFRAYWNPVEGL